MKQSSPPLSYLPLYIGLFATLFLASVCNSFLDIQYGSFTFETIIWGMVFAFSIHIGWKQRQKAEDTGMPARNFILAIGSLLSLFVFLPIWGLPRACVPILCTLQAAQNCVLRSHRDLYMGLLVSVILVIFATTHFRADWTMLFYLIPYVAAMVFTLVAEQTSRCIEDGNNTKLLLNSARSRGMAITTATLTILLVGAIFYLLTPKINLSYIHWKFGQVTEAGHMDGTGASNDNPGQGDQNGQTTIDQIPDWQDIRNGGWPTPEEMRKAAERKGMPEWQSTAIMQLADISETIENWLAPVKSKLSSLLEEISDWIKNNQKMIIASLITIIIILLLAAFFNLLKEIRLILWLHAHMDYFRISIFRLYPSGKNGVYFIYAALQRLGDLHGLARAPSETSREYLTKLKNQFYHLENELTEIVSTFEYVRYGENNISNAELIKINSCYCTAFRKMDPL